MKIFFSAVMATIVATIVATVAFFPSAHAQKVRGEIDLGKIEDSTDGFCVMELVNMAEGSVLRGKAAKSKIGFLNASVARAKAIYLNTKLTYIGGAKENELVVETRTLKSYVSGEKQVLASVVEISRGQDEDLVTFYFKNSENKPMLIAAVHSEQSAMAYWVCEY